MRKLFILAKTGKKDRKERRGQNLLWSLAKTRDKIQSCSVAHHCCVGSFLNNIEVIRQDSSIF